MATQDKSKKHILFLLGMYHPAYSANGVCVKNVVDQCIKAGYKVSCIVNDYYGEEKECVIDGASVYRIKHKLFDRVSQFCGRNKGKKGVSLIEALCVFFNKIKLFVTAPFWPQVSPLYTHRFYKKAKQLYKKDKFDTIIGVYTPVDSLIAGAKIKRLHPEVEYIPYYLDALAGGWGPSRWSVEKKEKHTRRAEEMADKYADKIFSMESSREYHEKNPLEAVDITKRCFLDVPLMKDIDKTVKSEISEVKKLFFSGAIVIPRRDVTPILQALLKACETKNFEAVFAGASNKPELFKKYEKLSQGKIKYIGKQSHQQVVSLQREADVLINVGSENKNTISGKIFEYMSRRKPVISTYKIDDEPSMEYLKKYGYALFIDERASAEENAKKIIGFLENLPSVDKTPQELEAIFYKNTAKAFIDYLEK